MAADVIKFVGATALATLLLAACGSGGNPLTGKIPGGVGGDGEDGASKDDNAVYDGEMNNMIYDAKNDRVIINNLPFDGKNGQYERTNIRTIPGFGVYANPRDGEAGVFRYYAVYKESKYGRVGAVGTGDYGDFGHYGTLVTTNGERVKLPITKGELIYSGDYAGVRIRDENKGKDVQLTSGKATMLVDLKDFDLTGAVLGNITDHKLYDSKGNFISDLETIILHEATIDEKNQIQGGTIETHDATGEPFQSGKWGGTFAGPKGQELLGFIFLAGPEDQDSDVQIQEHGVFVAVD